MPPGMGTELDMFYEVTLFKIEYTAEGVIRESRGPSHSLE